MIGLALSGGGSRAIAFHLGCLRALNDLGILDRLGVISTVSGGSVIGAYYAYTPEKSFEEFDSDICHHLRKGFHNKILLSLLTPNNLARCGTNFVITKAEGLTSWILRKQPRLQRYPSRSDLFSGILARDLFPGIKMSSRRRKDIAVVIGACELRTGSAFRFGNTTGGSWRHGQLVEWDVDVAFTVAASAAYPILLPAFDRTWRFKKSDRVNESRVLITDGGVYDNLGIQALEPGRSKEFSLHSFECKHIIACNAGHGQDSGEGLPVGYYRRLKQSFEVIHRRVQDSTMNRLHHLREAGLLEGFALPYLGQQDERLPIKPLDLVSRSEVLAYPTDFAAMSEEWIRKITTRGEQLTRTLLSHYLPHL